MKKQDNKFPVRVNGLSVEVYDNFDRAFRIFNKKVQEDGLLKECRDRMHYESGSEKRTKEKKMARKRWLKKVEKMRADGLWPHDKPAYKGDPAGNK